MAITIDNAGQSNSAVSGTTVVISSFVVGSGSNRYLLVGVSLNNHLTGGPSQVSSVTFGAAPLSLIDSVANSDDGLVEIWELINPANATSDITVTIDTNPDSSGFVAGAMSFEGVHQTTPTRTPWTEATSDTGAVTLDITSATDELVFDTVACEYTPGGIAVGADQTERWGIDVNSVHDINGYGSTESGASTVTMSWSGDTAHWALGAVSIRPAVIAQAAAGTITPSGSLARKTLKALAGSLTPAGSLVRKALKPLAGALTPAGSLSTLLFKAQAVAGSLVPSGSLARKVLKTLAGGLTPVGALARKTLKPLAGSLTPVGALATVHTRIQAAAGLLAPAGLLVVKTLKALAGSLAPSGSLTRKMLTALAGVIAPAGLLARKTLTALAGSLAPSGSLARKTLTALSGAITPAGSLATVHITSIVDINHEPGDLSEYTSTVTDGGRLSVTGAAALVDSFGMAGLINSTTSIYGEIEFTQFTSGLCRSRIYFDPNALSMATNNRFWLLIVRFNTSSRSLIEFNYDGSNYEVRASLRRDDSSFASTSFYNITDAPHYIEIYLEYASSAVASDGRLTLFIDGAQQEQLTGQDVFDLAEPNNARLGVQGPDAGTSGTPYFDDLVINDTGEEIGAAPSPPVGANPWYYYAQQQ